MYMWCVCVHVSTIAEWRPCREGRNLMRRERAIRKKKDYYLMLSLSRNLDSKRVHEGCLVRVREPVGRAGEDERAVG